MWSYIYLLACIISIIRILYRKFDVISLATLSFIYYTSSCLSGVVYITRSTGYYFYSDISSTTYICVITQLVLMNIVPMFVSEKRVSFSTGIDAKNFTNTENVGKRDFFVIDTYDLIFIASVLIFVYNIIFEIGISTFFSMTSKTDLIESANFLFSLSIWGILISFGYSLQAKKRGITILCSICLLLILILGSRSYFTVGVIIALLYYLENIAKFAKNNIKVLIFIVILAFGLMIYKEIYKYVRALDFQSVISVLTSVDTYEKILTSSESRTTFSLYEYIVQTDYHLSIGDSLVRIISIIPFVNNLIPTEHSVRFSSIATNEIFHSSYGLGSTFWGESYAMGGALFLFLMTAIWIGLLKKYSSNLNENNPTFCFVVPFISYVSFYIHRLDWVQVWGAFKSIAVWFIVFWVINNLLSSKREYW